MSHNSTVFSHVLLTFASAWALQFCMPLSGPWKWCNSTFLIIFVNSAIGIIRYARRSTSVVEDAYDWTLFLRSIAALPCLVCHFYLMYGARWELAYLHVAAAAVPIFQRLFNSSANTSNNQIVDGMLLGNVLSLGYICIIHENYYGLNVALTFAFAQFVVSDHYTYLDFPAIDFYNYLMCFFCFFGIKGMTAGR